jgi:pyruvate kinase
MTGTKIVATVGPACESPDILSLMVSSGVNAFRFNLKYNTHEWHETIIRRIRDITNQTGQPISVMVDIPGIEKASEWMDLATGNLVDYIALSYIKTVDDVVRLNEEVAKRNSGIKVIAKIETAEAMAKVEDIINVSAGVMVARGDLGAALPIEEIPYDQKHIIKLSLERGKPVITATEMLESMIANPTPTRAEVSDVANAMYDLTDAVMLSAESASGKYPVEAVKVMRRVATFIDTHRPLHPVKYQIRNQTDALTIAANDLAKQEVIEAQKIKAFVIVTETGQTAQSIARLRPAIPIIAITRNEIVRNQLKLVWGVVPLYYPVGNDEKDVHIASLRELLKKSQVVEEGSHVIMVYGSEVGISGNTNVLRIEVV